MENQYQTLQLEKDPIAADSKVFTLRTRKFLKNNNIHETLTVGSH